MANRGPLGRAVLFGSVAACLALVGLAGCGSSNSDGPRALPSLPGQPSPSPSASLPVVPTLGPSPSVEQIKASAEAFVRRYFALLNATPTPATIDELSAMVDAACQPCQRDLVGRREMAREQQHYAGARYQIDSLVVGQPEGLATTADLMLSVSAGSVVDRSGQQVVAIPSSAPSQIALSLGHPQGSWKIINILVFPK